MREGHEVRLSEEQREARDATDRYLLVLASAGSGQLVTLGDAEDGTLLDFVQGADPTFEDVPRGPDDLAAILYTSGTTGRSKGAMLTSANLASNAAVLKDCWRFTEADQLLHALPIFHTHGLFVACNTLLLAGGSMLFLKQFDIEQILALLPRATTMMGVVTNAEKGGRTPTENWLQIVLSSQFKLDNKDGIADALKKLVRYYPKAEYWENLLDIYRRKDTSDRVTLGYYRLMNEVGTLKQADDYVEMAQLAIDAGVPGEAQAIVEKGVQGGTLKSEDKTTQGRYDRLLASAKKSAAEDKACVRSLLPVIEPAARIMRARVQHPADRLGCDHLAPHRADGLVELGDETARVPVGGDHDAFGLERVQ